MNETDGGPSVASGGNSQPVPPPSTTTTASLEPVAPLPPQKFDWKERALALLAAARLWPSRFAPYMGGALIAMLIFLALGGPWLFVSGYWLCAFSVGLYLWLHEKWGVPLKL